MKEVDIIRIAKLYLVLLCGFIFLFACIPTALGCSMDVKPGSCPDSINLDKNGLVPIAIEDKGAAPETVNLYLRTIDADGVHQYYLPGIKPVRYEFVNNMIISPCTLGNSIGDSWLGPYYEGPGYILKFDTQDFSKVLAEYDNKENLYLGVVIEGTFIEYWDSVRFIDNK